MSRVKLGLVSDLKSRFTERERKTLDCRENGRSTDFIIPSIAIGCEHSYCTYCYVARRRELGNPLEIYTNLEEIWSSIENHANSRQKKLGNQCHKTLWTYDIGESTDMLSSTMVHYTNWLVGRFLSKTNVMPSFATKLVNNNLHDVNWKPRYARVRVSLMPDICSKVLEPGTSSIKRRIQSINELYDKGYEVHINFSPVIFYKGWKEDYIELFSIIRNEVSPFVLNQLKAEVIFLIHDQELHTKNLNLGFEFSEKIMWVPNLQEAKINQRGGQAYRYSYELKKSLVSDFRRILGKEIPECEIRYIF